MRPFLLVVIGGLAAQLAIAQYDIAYVDLLPSTVQNGNSCRGNDGNQQVGFVGNFNDGHASLWSGSAESFVDLHPVDATFSEAHGVADGQQVGMANINSVAQAVVWTGSASSIVSLHPTNAISSEAYATTGSNQVGAVFYSGGVHAGLWFGTAASFVDLHPSGASYSVAFGVSGLQQVGQVTNHAALWSGNSASIIDLHPATAISSFAAGISGGQQVGATSFGNRYHACIWFGSSNSFIDIHPLNASESFAWGTVGNAQAGTVSFNDVSHAGVWFGTANTFLDLHNSLGNQFLSSNLDANQPIWTDGSVIKVCGSAVDTNGSSHPILWTLNPVRPSLSILLTNAETVLSWPTNFVGYHLEDSVTLPSSSWSPVTNTTIVSAQSWSVTLPASSGHRFFRLAKP